MRVPILRGLIALALCSLAFNAAADNNLVWSGSLPDLPGSLSVPFAFPVATPGAMGVIVRHEMTLEPGDPVVLSMFEAGLGRHVLVPGFRPDLAEFIGCFDLLVHPALDEGLGVVLLEASAAGVPIVAGTDVGNPFVVPGRSLHDELSAYVQAGMSPLEALRTATLNPVRVLGLSDSLGTIVSGKLADLVLLSADPLADIENVREIEGVVRAGRYYSRTDLDTLTAAALQAGMPDGQ